MFIRSEERTARSTDFIFPLAFDTSELTIYGYSRTAHAHGVYFTSWPYSGTEVAVNHKQIPDNTNRAGK